MRNVFVISLPQDADRYHDFLEHHRPLSRSVSITKIEGVQGSKLTPKERRIACKSWLHRPWLTDSMMGCGLSHLKALRKFIDQKDATIALILEDDARIHIDTDDKNINSKWDALEKQMKEKEVDLVHLGGHETKEGYNLLVRGILWQKEKNKDADEIVPIFWWSTTGSYAVTQRGAKCILEALEGKMNYHVDMVYHGLIRRGIVRGMCVRSPWFMIQSDYKSHNADGHQLWMTKWVDRDIVHLILTMSILRLPIIGSVTPMMVCGGILLSILPLPLMFLLILFVRGRIQKVWGVQFLSILLFPQTRKAWFVLWWMVLLLFAIVFLTTIR
jgi:GR25 family glycosyltransferase involved in LPS biosynthesis